MPDIADRVVNLGVIVTVILAGLAYGFWFLWAMNIRDTVRLWLVAVMPGVVFLTVILAIRLAQGSPATLYAYLVLDFVIFGNAAFAAVILRRWRAHRRHASEHEQGRVASGD